jgi:ADP-heptose:LPS heptosyltransferase
MLDDEGRGRHAFRHHAKDDPGYCGLAASQRNVISVTGACLLTRRDTFDALDGFDEEHVIINNDVDFCLRAWRSGLLSVFTPYARLIHHEMISRSLLGEQFGAQKFTAAWGELIARGDPYFNPNLSRNSESFEIEREPVEAVHAGHPLFARESIHRILVLKLDHIGDCLTAIPAVRRLKQLFPAARITVAAGRSTLPVWQPLPEVDEIIEFNFFHARSGLGTVAVADEAMARFAAQLRRGRFDLAVDLRKQPDTRHILEQCGARLRAGYDSQGRFPWLDVALEWDEDVGLRAKRSHVADDLRCLVEAIATQSDRSRQVLAPPAPRRPASARARALLAQTAPFVCIHPAAGSEMRQWPASHFGQLIDLLLDSGKVRVVLIGGPDERSFAEAVLANVASSIRSSVPSGASSGASSSGALVDLVGQLDLSELPSVLSRALLFIGNNSGPQHWAAALGIPTVGIHSGVVDAREWGPLGPRAVALRRRMSCSPCFIERRDDCPRQLACLTGLKPIDVFRRCRAFLPTAEGRRGKGGIAPSTVDATVREIA